MSLVVAPVRNLEVFFNHHQKVAPVRLCLLLTSDFILWQVSAVASPTSWPRKREAFTEAIYACGPIYLPAKHRRFFVPREPVNSLGATVVIAARKLDQLTAVAEEIRKLGGKCDTMQINIRDADKALELIENVVTKHGKLTCLVV